MLAAPPPNVRVSGIWFPAPVSMNSRRICGRAHTTCKQPPCSAARWAARTRTSIPAGPMELVWSRSAISGRPLAAQAYRCSCSRATAAMSISGNSDDNIPVVFLHPDRQRLAHDRSLPNITPRPYRAVSMQQSYPADRATTTRPRSAGSPRNVSPGRPSPTAPPGPRPAPGRTGTAHRDPPAHGEARTAQHQAAWRSGPRPVFPPPHPAGRAAGRRRRPGCRGRALLEETGAPALSRTGPPRGSGPPVCRRVTRRVARLQLCSVSLRVPPSRKFHAVRDR
jgi:hypothetical protein